MPLERGLRSFYGLRQFPRDDVDVEHAVLFGQELPAEVKMRSPPSERISPGSHGPTPNALEGQAE